MIFLDPRIDRPPRRSLLPIDQEGGELRADFELIASCTRLRLWTARGCDGDVGLDANGQSTRRIADIQRVLELA